MSPDPSFFLLATRSPVSLPRHLVSFFAGFGMARRPVEVLQPGERDSHALARLREAAGATTAGATS